MQDSHQQTHIKVLSCLGATTYSQSATWWFTCGLANYLGRTWPPVKARSFTAW